MSTRINHLFISLSISIALALPALADDVEIFFNESPLSTGEPLVMFSLDYRPNLASTICNFGESIAECGWENEINTAFEVSDTEDGTIDFLEMLRAALRRVLSEVSGIRVGLMLNHGNINNCENKVSAGCSNGGYIAQGFQSIDADLESEAKTGRDNLLDNLKNLPPTKGSISHSYQGKELYFELFRYLSGQGIYNGHVGHVDYGDPCSRDNLDDRSMFPVVEEDEVEEGEVTEGCKDDDDSGALVSWDTAIEKDKATYVSPFTDVALECSSVYAINFMFGVSSQDSDSDDAITASKESGGMGGIDLSGKRNNFATVVDWLSSKDLSDLEGQQDVTSYFLYKGNVQNTMNGYAYAGGTGQALEIGDDPQQLVDDLKTIFKQILRQNATFEAPAVTVNSYTRLTHRDVLFYALFSPEDTPDWPGNLKKYKLANLPVDLDGDGETDKKVVRIVDKNNLSAVDADSALFQSTACSFWSDCNIDRDGDGNADADGDIVAWGGAAEQVTTAEDPDRPRAIYTDTGDSVNEVLDTDSNRLHEDNDSITAEMLGINTTNATDIDEDSDVDETDVSLQRQRLLKLARGLDPLTGLGMQSLGDPIHARPSVVVYDADLIKTDTSEGVGANPDMAVVMTTNQGTFHLIDTSTGQEHFAWTPREQLDLIKRIYGPESFDPEDGKNRFSLYGLDGSPLIYFYDSDDNGLIEKDKGDKVVAYVTQRRGGRNIYALDITEKNNPILKWKILGGVTSGFDLLGDTWSEPELTKIKVGGVDKNVLVFGGGYDDSQDDSYSRSDDVGRGIYVVDANTGERIWTISKDGSPDLSISSMENGIPSRARVLDIDEDGYIDRIYAVDIIGRVFRVDFSTSEEATTIQGGGLVASLFPSTCEDISCQRRFYNAPDIAVMVGYMADPYVQIAMGSGYRAHPVSIEGIQDRFYMLFDTHVVDPVVSADYGTSEGKFYHWTEDANLVDVTEPHDFETESETGYEAMNTNVQESLTAEGKHGWYINMDIDKEEKVLSESITVKGKTLFTTYLRDDAKTTKCEPNLGQGRIYVINSFTGLPIADLNTAVGVGDLDSVEKEHRYKDLNRTGIPSDPLIVFRKDEDGDVTPTVVVTTELPLPEKILGSNLHAKTWWIDFVQ